MSNKYEAYIKVGNALKHGDERLASDIAKIIIKSDRLHRKKGVYFTEELLVSRSDKKVLKDKKY